MWLRFCASLERLGLRGLRWIWLVSQRIRRFCAMSSLFASHEQSFQTCIADVAKRVRTIPDLGGGSIVSLAAHGNVTY